MHTIPPLILLHENGYKFLAAANGSGDVQLKSGCYSTSQYSDYLAPHCRSLSQRIRPRQSGEKTSLPALQRSTPKADDIFRIARVIDQG